MSQFLKLLLLAPPACSAVFSLLLVAPTYANTTNWVSVSKSYVCQRTPTREAKQIVCKRVNASTAETGQVFDLTKAQEMVVDEEASNGAIPLTFELTDEESNASVALFGCDCPACIRSLRQLRNMMS